MVRGADRLGGPVERVACWKNHPLGAPLRSSSPVGGQLGTIGLDKNNLAPRLNGTSLADGLTVMTFQVENHHDEEVYFEAGWTHAAISGSKSWTRSSVVTSVGNVQLKCATNISNCDSSWPYPTEQKTESVTIAAGGLVAGTLVYDITGGGGGSPKGPCSGCSQNRYKIDPRDSAGSPRIYRVHLILTGLTKHYPGPSYSSSYSEYSLLGHQLTGKLLSAYTRCTKKTIIGGIDGEMYCTERTTYRAFLALSEVRLNGGALEGIVETSPTTAGPWFELPSLVTPRPKYSLPLWQSTDDLPSPLHPIP